MVCSGNHHCKGHCLLSRLFYWQLETYQEMLWLSQAKLQFTKSKVVTCGTFFFVHQNYGKSQSLSNIKLCKNAIFEQFKPLFLMHGEKKYHISNSKMCFLFKTQKGLVIESFQQTKSTAGSLCIPVVEFRLYGLFWWFLLMHTQYTQRKLSRSQFYN